MLSNAHTLKQTRTITCILPLLSFGWVKSSKTPDFQLTCLPPHAAEEQAQKRGAGKCQDAHFSDNSIYRFMT